MKNFIFFTTLSLVLSFLLFTNNPLHKDFSSSNFILNEKNEDNKYIFHTRYFAKNKKDGVESLHSHSSSLANTKKGKLLVFFAGTREGATDVAIYQVFLDDSNSIKNPKKILDSSMLSDMSGKFIKKLGNPVIFTDLKGTTHLFVVGVSLGGWATSKIYHLAFDEKVEKLQYKEELKLGLIANLSHLVRNNAVLMQDNQLNQSGFILPIYHELARKYPLLAYFDENGKFLYAKRINSLKNQLQPSMTVLNEKEILLSFRNYNAYNNALFLQKCDINAHCEKPFETGLKNYDSANLLFSFYQDKKLHTFLIQNKSDDEKNRRKELVIYALNGKKLCEIYTLDKSQEISYPSVLIENSMLYTSYTYDRVKIGLNILPLIFLAQTNLKDKPCF